jgi:hypothetical protein
MQVLPTPDPKRLRITDTVDKHVTAMLEELNELHTEFSYPDEDIVAALREGGYGHEADLYEDWIADEDPARKVNAPDPEGPGPGVVPDPPSDSYIELEKRLNEQRNARSITYNWAERERVIYSCRATVDREAFQRWLNQRPGVGPLTPDDVDGGDVVDYLEANPGASIDERRWPADESEVDIFDLKVVEP